VVVVVFEIGDSVVVAVVMWCRASMVSAPVTGWCRLGKVSSTAAR
jgi:hypothetical protein